jgi:hypothetical protein
MTFDWLDAIDVAVLYPPTTVLIGGVAELGAWLGW